MLAVEVDGVPGVRCGREGVQPLRWTDADPKRVYPSRRPRYAYRILGLSPTTQAGLLNAVRRIIHRFLHALHNCRSSDASRQLCYPTFLYTDWWAMDLLKSKLYTSVGYVTGGRDGHGRSEGLDVPLRAPRELGGSGGGANPESLFAVGFGACFLSALGVAARARKIDVSRASLRSDVTLGKTEDDKYALAVKLTVLLPDVPKPLASELAREAEALCPYSRAVQGNVDVSLVVL